MKTLILFFNFLFTQIPYNEIEICELEEYVRDVKDYYVVKKPLSHKQKINVTCNGKIIGYYFYAYNRDKMRDIHVGTYILRTKTCYWLR
jgi:hypothetical protein